jgi:hypothetical protein
VDFALRQFFPAFWRPDASKLLPTQPAIYVGPNLPLWVTYLLLTAITVRSCIHIFLPDGGAHSIATIDISVAGGSNIVGLFGQWGAIQLLLVGLLWLLILRYRGLLPVILCTLIAEPFLRSLAGHLKPITTVHPAPGAVFNFVFLPLLSVLLYMALCPGHKQQ